MKRSTRYARRSTKEKRQQRRERLLRRWFDEYRQQLADDYHQGVLAAAAHPGPGWWRADPEDDFFDRVLI